MTYTSGPHHSIVDCIIREDFWNGEKKRSKNNTVPSMKYRNTLLDFSFFLLPSSLFKLSSLDPFPHSLFLI